SIAFSLPTEITDAEFETLWGAIDEECRDLGISVFTGHTARYPGCTFPWVGAATAMAVGDHEAIVRPDGARPGDVLVVTNGPAVEATGLFASLFPDEIPLSARSIDTAADRLAETQTVRDTSALGTVEGVTAMHDATEGGLLGGLHEMATSAGVRFEVDRDAVPIRPGVNELCDALEMDPWTATSSGTLLITASADAAETVLDVLERRGTAAAIVGTVREGRGVVVDGTETDAPTEDASWSVYAELSG
ncbi:MAG: AIR synthase-related protein, partial [Halobacteriota archaeon]